MPVLIHRLTHASQIQGTTVACGDVTAQLGSFDRARVTCPACLAPRPPAAPGPAERHLQEQIRQACALQGWLYYHTTDSRKSPAGFPDVCAVRGERLLFAELKRAGQHPTPAQQAWLDALAQVQTVEVYWWHPHDWPQIVERLR